MFLIGAECSGRRPRETVKLKVLRNSQVRKIPVTAIKFEDCLG